MVTRDKNKVLMKSQSTNTILALKKKMKSILQAKEGAKSY